MQAASRSLPLVALVLGVAILVVQIRVIAGGQTWDDVRYHTEVAPPRLAAAEAVQRGEVPAWWDGSGLGVTLAGEPSHGALYPPQWLAATPRALDLALIAHLAWAALGVCVWARRRTSDRSALVAGVLVATTGILMSAGLRGALPGLAQLPWLGAAVGWLGRGETRRERGAAACAIALLIAAIALVGELALLIDAIAIAAALSGRNRARWLVAAIAVGVAIGAVQWIPALCQLPGEAGADGAGLPLARLVELLVPGSFGGAAGASPCAPSLFVGAPLLALASVRAPPRQLLAVIGGLAAAALLTGRGHWPAWLGAPELHVAALALVLAVAAADGLDALISGQRRAVVALIVGVGFAIVALGALAALRIQHADLAAPIDRALLDGALGVVCMAGAVVLAWRAPGRQIAVLFALLVAPGVGAAQSIAPTIDRDVVTEPPPWALAAARLPRPVRVYRPIQLNERASVEDAIATFAGGSAWRWRIAGARSEDPARPEAHDRTWLAAAHEGGALLDRYGVALAILPATVANARKLKVLGRRGSWALVELPVAPPAAVMGTIVLAGSGPAGPTAQLPVPCAIQRWSDGDIELSCTSEAAGYAVVSSTAAAGWEVSVDGRDADWLAADVLRRAVAIPSGTHAIRWRYSLPGLWEGELIGLVGLLGLIALWSSGRRWGRSSSVVSGTIVN